MTLQIVDNYSNTLVDTVQVAYTAPSDKNVVIDSFTAANNSSVSANYTAYIKSNTGEEVPQIPYKIVVWGENDLGIGIVNQVIPAGGQLLFESSAIDSIYFTVSGREFSS